MEIHVGNPILPGDIAIDAQIIKGEAKKVILGPGLKKFNEKIVASKSGVLKQRANTFWIDSYQKRYIPNRGETVVGQVVGKSGDIFRVDIGSSDQAYLSYLAFEGATKKNRPDINIGDLLFARIVIANKDLEPELVCVDSHGKKEKLGVLNGGYTFNCSINLIRKILNEKSILLKQLGKEVAFDLAAGMNGRIWIKGKSVKETIAIGNAILASESILDKDMPALCNKVGKILSGIISDKNYVGDNNGMDDV